MKIPVVNRLINNFLWIIGYRYNSTTIPTCAQL